MKKHQKLSLIHNGKYGEHGGFVGLIPDEETYEKLKAGEVDWKAPNKARMKQIQLPVEIFYRLMVMDTDESFLQALITYVDESVKRQQHEYRWVTDQGEEVATNVNDIRTWWENCMKPELVRALVVDPDAK